jgi:hypothetical protein
MVGINFKFTLSTLHRRWNNDQFFFKNQAKNEVLLEELTRYNCRKRYEGCFLAEFTEGFGRVLHYA